LSRIRLAVQIEINPWVV